MSLMLGDKVIVGPGNSPYIGENGNWFVGTQDTMVSAGTQFYYKTSEEFRSCFDKGIYFVYDESQATIEEWHINENGIKHIVTDKTVLVPTVGSNGNWFIGSTDTGIPASGDGSTIAGAAIDDDNIDTTTTWSSNKSNSEIQKLKEDGIPGKSLEFKWDDSRLGVRIEDTEEYYYQDLIGPAGLTGLDGSSVFDAELDGGDLILTLQDIDTEEHSTHEILSLESHLFTTGDLENILNNINRLNKEIYNIRTSQFRDIVTADITKKEEYQLIYNFTGSGRCQIITTPFKGTLKVILDGAEYTYTIPEDATLGESNLVTISTQDRLRVVNLFDSILTTSLDINFKTALNIQIKLDNELDTAPRMLLQGDYYYVKPNSDPGGGSGGSEGGGGDYIPGSYMTEIDVDDMMGII